MTNMRYVLGRHWPHWGKMWHMLDIFDHHKLHHNRHRFYVTRDNIWKGTKTWRRGCARLRWNKSCWLFDSTDSADYLKHNLGVTWSLIRQIRTRQKWQRDVARIEISLIPVLWHFRTAPRSKKIMFPIRHFGSKNPTILVKGISDNEIDKENQ